MDPIFLELPAVANATTLSEPTIQRMVRENIFPKPRLLSNRRVGWLVSEIKEWASMRPISDLPPPPNTGKRSAS